MSTEDRADAFRMHMVRALQIADASAVSLIETECAAEPATESGPTWYDTRPLLDVREYSGELVDLNVQSITYGLERGLLARHPAADRAHLVRVVRRFSN